MATLKDVAKKAGVNISTASRALNGGMNISPETCDRVKQAAEALNYSPNLSARIMVGKGSRIIGCIVPEVDSNYFARIIFEIEKRLQSKGYFLMIANTQYNSEKEIAALNTFCQYNVDGIFLACTIHQDILDKFAQPLKDKGIPLVLIEARLHSNDYNYIMIDDEAGITHAIGYLKERGYSRVGFLSDYILVDLRNDQFVAALRHNGMDPADNPIYIHKTMRFETAGYEMMKLALADPNRPNAFLAGYDDIAIGAMRAIDEAGLRVPEDIALIGNDNIREAPFLHKALTTLSPPLERMAELGVDLMISCVENNELGIIHRIQLLPELIIRETT